MAQPTTWKVPAITAGTKKLRSFTRDGREFQGGWAYPYRTALQVYNKSNAVAILYVEGEEVGRCAAGDLLVYDRDTQIPFYELDATANTSANEIEVTESGGLDTPVDAQMVVAPVKA